MMRVSETKRAAEEAVRLAAETGVVLDYSRRSVVALDDLLLEISRSAEQQGRDDDETWDLACIYGSYLGECMLRNDFNRLGFAWGEDTDGEPCLKPTSKATGAAANLSRSVPITKAYKRIVNGEQDSAAQFYASTLLMVSDDDCSEILSELGQEAMPVEPKYVGANGKVSATAAAWLFSEDVVFFLDEQIAWDGKSHSALGMQINADKINSAPILMSSYQTILPGVMDLISTIEQDEGLRVPLGMIHPALHNVLHNEDLTGLTLFNLMACAHALIVKENTPDTYTVVCDSRLPAGIPSFYQLVARMIWDMRAYNDRSSAFKIGFANARNLDADMLLGEVDKMVPGAFSQAVWQVDVTEKPRVELTGNAEIQAFAGGASHVFASGFDEPTEMQADEELFEAVLNQLAREFPITQDIEGTHHMGRIPRIEHVRVGDPLVLAADWQSEWFDPVCIEVFNADGETLGNLRERFSFALSGNRELACLLPHITASVETVTPKSKRRKNAKYALMDVRMELDKAVLGKSGKLLPEVVDAAKLLLSLPKGERVVTSKGNLVASQLKGNIKTNEAHNAPNPLGDTFKHWELAGLSGEDGHLTHSPRPVESRVAEKREGAVVPSDKVANEVALDQDMLDQIAYTAIFHDGPVNASLVYGLFPELESAEIAEQYLEGLLRSRVVERSEADGFISAITFEGYALDQLKRQETKLKREGYYDLIMLALIDYGDYAKLDDLLVSVDGLPGRNEVRSLLLEGVEKGDLVRKGTRLTFACALDEEASQTWKRSAEERGRQRTVELKTIATRRSSLTRNKKERDRMQRSYEASFHRYEESEARRREEEAERNRQLDLAAVDLLVEALGGYRLGNGFVSARWVQENVQGVSSIERAQDLLELGWSGGRIRRAKKDGVFIYARQFTPEEWVPIRDEANARLNAEYEKRFQRLKALRVQMIDSRIQDASMYADVPRKMIELYKGLTEENESQCQEIDRKLRDNELAMARLADDAKRMTDELNATVFFMLSKKKELKARIGQVSAQLEALRRQNISLRRDREMLQRDLIEAREELESSVSEMNRRKNAVVELEHEKDAIVSEECPKPESRELVTRMWELSKLWACPVDASWFCQNVNDLESAEQAEGLLQSADSKRVFVQLDNGLYTLKDIGADTSDQLAKHMTANKRIQLKLGSKITIGQFGGPGESTKLRWTILDIDRAERAALLLCDRIITSEPFSRGKQKASWSDCGLASWLNEEFMGKAFSKEEARRLIVRPELRMIFVLSEEEFKTYRKRGRIKPPEVPNDIVSSKRGSWWLRTNGESERRVMYVTEKNRLSAKGMGVRSSLVGVRPAIWVDMDCLP